jgi:hypothetical protein
VSTSSLVSTRHFLAGFLPRSDKADLTFLFMMLQALGTNHAAPATRQAERRSSFYYTKKKYKIYSLLGCTAM